eukprot:7574152-Lingulodinium_polyedra.AAC.1
MVFAARRAQQDVARVEQEVARAVEQERLGQMERRRLEIEISHQREFGVHREGRLQSVSHPAPGRRGARHGAGVG